MFFAGCCRCKLTLGHKTEEGVVVFKTYSYSSSILNRINPTPLYFYNVSMLGQHHTFQTCYGNTIRLPATFSHAQPLRGFRTSRAVSSGEPNKPSSKVEETTEIIKEKAKEVSEKKVEMSAPIKDSAVVKKHLGERIMDEVRHYYHGFRLLFIDIRVSSVLVWKVLKGDTLSRREYNLVKLWLQYYYFWDSISITFPLPILSQDSFYLQQ